MNIDHNFNSTLFKDQPPITQAQLAMAHSDAPSCALPTLAYTQMN